MTEEPSYRPDGITRARNLKRGPHPAVRTKKGRRIRCKTRKITLRVDAKRYKSWCAAAGANEYRDLRRWLAYLANAEVVAFVDPS